MHDVDSDALSSSLHAYRHRLDHLLAEGRQLQEALATAPGSSADLDALRVWQRACAATIGQLSGGSKAHWLARAYSDGLLVPRAESASVTTIIDRILDVLDRACASLAHADGPRALGPGGDAPPAPPRARFTFIGDEALRSGLERAYLDGQAALLRGEFALALITSCSILEAVITEALDRQGLDRLAAHDPPAGPIVDWPFVSRIAIAERARLISAGCARLPEVAREYRALLDARGEIQTGVSVSSRDAKLASHVLHVILRDLSPGR